MFRRILVPTDGSESAGIGVRYAVALASRHPVVLHGLHVVDVKLLEGPFLRDLSASLGTAPYVNYQNNISLILEERGRAALTAFQEASEQAKVTCETTLTTGIVPRTIVEYASLSDLVILGRSGEHSQWLEGLVGSTTEAVVRRATQPVLVTGVEQPGFDRFLVAYDGSHYARRALKTAATISEAWHMPFHVLVVGDAETLGLLDEARNYFQAYPVQVEYAACTGDPAEQIIHYAQKCSADFIVMGAYGHSKVRELVLGSTTAYAINHASCPVLLTR
ncbi:MAG TPA: universal stress protein [Candidatus Hydrogenedentes bacterium]|nr:universal stress protein [Candidatus Hydrogenedentota bacterium]